MGLFVTGVGETLTAMFVALHDGQARRMPLRVRSIVNAAWQCEQRRPVPRSTWSIAEFGTSIRMLIILRIVVPKFHECGGRLRRERLTDRHIAAVAKFGFEGAHVFFRRAHAVERSAEP